MVERIEKLSRNGFTIYPVSPHLAFALSRDRILMLTPTSSYIVSKNQLNSRAGHARIRRGILNNQYKCMADVLTDMRLTPGVGVSYRQLSMKEIYD